MSAAPPRHEPRFVYLAEPAARPAANDGATRFSWRLHAANHRALGGSPGPQPTLAECRAAAAAARRTADRLAPTLRVDAGRSAWTWELVCADRPGVAIAVSVHSYLRRIACQHALEQFLAGIRVADPETGIVRQPATSRSSGGPRRRARSDRP